MAVEKVEDFYEILCKCASADGSIRSSAEMEIKDLIINNSSAFYTLSAEIICNDKIQMNIRNISLIILKNVFVAPNPASRKMYNKNWALLDDSVRKRIIDMLFQLVYNDENLYKKNVPTVLGAIISIAITSQIDYEFLESLANNNYSDKRIGVPILRMFKTASIIILNNKQEQQIPSQIKDLFLRISLLYINNTAEPGLIGEGLECFEKCFYLFKNDNSFPEKVDLFTSKLFSLHEQKDENVVPKIFNAISNLYEVIYGNEIFVNVVNQIEVFCFEYSRKVGSVGVKGLIHFMSTLIRLNNYFPIEDNLNIILPYLFEHLITKDVESRHSLYYSISQFIIQYSNAQEFLIRNEIVKSFIRNQLSSDFLYHKLPGIIIFGCSITSEIEPEFLRLIIPSIISNMFVEEPFAFDEIAYALSKTISSAFPLLEEFMPKIISNCIDIIQLESDSAENAINLIIDVAEKGDDGNILSKVLDSFFFNQKSLLNLFLSMIDTNSDKPHPLRPTLFLGVLSIIKMGLDEQLIENLIVYSYSKIFFTLSKNLNLCYREFIIYEEIASGYISILAELLTMSTTINTGEFKELIRCSFDAQPSLIQCEIYMAISKNIDKLELEYIYNILAFFNHHLETMEEPVIESILIFLDAFAFDKRCKLKESLSSLLEKYYNILFSEKVTVELKGKVLESIGTLALISGKQFLDHFQYISGICNSIIGLKRDDDRKNCDFIRKRMLKMLSCILIGSVKFPGAIQHSYFVEYINVCLGDQGCFSYSNEALDYIGDCFTVFSPYHFKNEAVQNFLTSIITKKGRLSNVAYSLDKRLNNK